MKDNDFEQNQFQQDDDFDFDAREYRKMYDQSKRRARKKHRSLFDLKLFQPRGNKKHSQQPPQDNGEQKKKFWPRFWKVALSVFLVCVITGCLVVGAVMIYAFNFVDAKMAEDLENLAMNFTTTVYVQDEKSGDWVEYQRLHGGENRIWVPLEKIPLHLQKAYIAIEDKRFDAHNGVDWKRTFSAFANMFLHFYDSNQGGSTITQQLVKNLTGDKKQDAMRKIREIMRARYLEENFSKDTILECYLNVIGLANGISGVEVAANYYFDKNVEELSLVECAALAAMAKEPERYRPDKFPENNKARRATVLYEMYDQGYISKEEYEKAKEEELVVVASKENTKEVAVNSYFIDALIEEVIADLAETYNYDETYAAKNFYNGGYKIYCTMIPSVQNTIEKYFTGKTYFKETQEYNGQTLPVQGSMTIMDYQGHVVGLVGGQGEKTVNRGKNRAIAGYNQPGSTIKPLSAYAPAIENNVITYSTILKDKTDLKNDGKRWPKNWFGYYSGSQYAYKALERSINTIPVNLINQMGLQQSFDFLHDVVGYTSYDAKHDLNLASLGLGGSYKGVTTMQTTAAFAIFGNLGKYYEPSTYVAVKDQFNKKDILSNENAVPKVAISEDTAGVMNHMLQGVVYGSQGTGKEAKAYHSKMKMFAKTGTSNDQFDCWFIGGTPYYIGSCWYGFDYDSKVKYSSNAKSLWTKIMGEIHEDLPVKEFEESAYVTKRKYCKDTGLVATSKCTNVGVGYYKNSYMPTCTKHTGKVTGELGDDEDESKVQTPSSSAPPASSSAPQSSKPQSTVQSSSQSSAAVASSSQASGSSAPASSSEGTTTSAASQ